MADKQTPAIIPRTWSVQINLSASNTDTKISLEADESSILHLLRASYPMIESQIRAFTDQPPGVRPSGIVDEALTLLRCLVLNRLEPCKGNFLKIER